MRHYEIVLLIHPDQSEQVPAMLEPTRLSSPPAAAPRGKTRGRRQMAYMIRWLAMAACTSTSVAGKCWPNLKRVSVSTTPSFAT